MRKILFGATFLVAAALFAQTSVAGPACCKKKAKTETVAAKSSCSKATSSCSSTASLAKSSSCEKSSEGFPQIRFMVAGETYDTQPEAWAALASASEEYVSRYTSIACVVDGKVKYCGEDACAGKAEKTACAKATEVKLASNKSCSSADKIRARKMALTKMDKKACCGSKPTKLAADRSSGCSESKGEQAKLASAKDTRTCPLTGKVVTVDAKGNSSCCKKPCGDEAKVKTVAAESKGGCCKSKMAKLAKTESKSCGEKAKLVKAEGSCKSKESKLAKAEGQSCSSKAKLASAKDGCCKSKMTKLAKAENKTCASKAKLVKAEGKTCDKSAKLAKADGCCKSKEAKLAKAESKSCSSSTKLASAKDGCCKSKMTKLAKADGCCKDAKNVMYRVAGRNFKTWNEANIAREKAIEAMKSVKMAYVVNGEKVDCASKVCPTMKKAGKVKFVVNKTETNCELQARVAMAKAQLEAVKLTVNDMVAAAN